MNSRATSTTASHEVLKPPIAHPRDDTGSVVML
jgi:hypothetical protein